MNCACRAISFVDEHTLATSGLDAEVYVWGLQVNPLICLLYISPAPTPLSLIMRLINVYVWGCCRRSKGQDRQR